MKKFLFLACLLLSSVMAMAAQANYSAPEQDIGYEQVTVASIYFEGQAFVSFDNMFNVVEWQTPQVLSQVSDMSAQVMRLTTA